MRQLPVTALKVLVASRYKEAIAFPEYWKPLILVQRLYAQLRIQLGMRTHREEPPWDFWRCPSSLRRAGWLRELIVPPTTLLDSGVLLDDDMEARTDTNCTNQFFRLDLGITLLLSGCLALCPLPALLALALFSAWILQTAPDYETRVGFAHMVLANIVYALAFLAVAWLQRRFAVSRTVCTATAAALFAWELAVWKPETMMVASMSRDIRAPWILGAALLVRGAEAWRLPWSCGAFVAALSQLCANVIHVHFEMMHFLRLHGFPFLPYLHDGVQYQLLLLRRIALAFVLSLFLYILVQAPAFALLSGSWLRSKAKEQ